MGFEGGVPSDPGGDRQAKPDDRYLIAGGFAADGPPELVPGCWVQASLRRILAPNGQLRRAEYVWLESCWVEPCDC